MHDILKNVTSIFDCKQTRRARYEYAPLGALITAQGDRAQENKFRFSCEFMTTSLAWSTTITATWILQMAGGLTGILFGNTEDETYMDLSKIEFLNNLIILVYIY